MTFVIAPRLLEHYRQWPSRYRTCHYPCQKEQVVRCLRHMNCSSEPCISSGGLAPISFCTSSYPRIKDWKCQSTMESPMSGDDCLIHNLSYSCIGEASSVVACVCMQVPAAIRPRAIFRYRVAGVGKVERAIAMHHPILIQPALPVT
jgi:hypothetical protein